MSVINTMLKDLERRGAGNSNSGDNILGGLSSSGNVNLDDESSSKIYWLSIAGAIAVAVIVGGIYYLSPYQLVSVAQNKVELAKEDRPQVAQDIQATPTITKPLIVEPVTTQSTPVTAVAKTTDIPNDDAVVAQKSSAVTLTRNEPIAVKSASIVKPVMLQAQLEDTDLEEDTAASMLVVTKQQREFTADEKSRQAYATGMMLYNQGRKQESKSALLEAISYSDINVDAFRLLSVIYLEDGRTDLAAEIVDRGLTRHATDQSLLRLYLQVLVQREKYAEAIIVMEQRLHLTSPDDMGYLAGLYQKNNDHLNAVKLYAQALQLIPSKSVWWMGQGISLEIMKQYKEATHSYEKSLSTGQLSGKLSDYAISRINLIKQHNAGSVS